jgi:sugar lactone lactonase YvrE
VTGSGSAAPDGPGASLGTARLIVDARATLGEGPLWDADRGILWWVDILGGIVHAFDPATGRDEAIEVGQAVGAVALRHDGNLLAIGQDAILALDPETQRLEPVFAFALENPPRRTNDAKPDPGGRLWVERMPFDHAAGMGSLRRLGRDLRLEAIISDITIPNGLAWSPDGGTMYFAESMSRVVTAYDFDAATGTISGGRPFIRIGAGVGLPPNAVPDGLAVDAERCVWVAIWNGYCVVRVSPDGAIVGRVDLPVSQVSSVSFGGPELADLYITSAREDFDEAAAAREPNAGGLFRVTTPFRGLLPYRFAG